MDSINLNYFGHTRAWWVVLCIGILMMICGFCYWLFPQIGYAVSSTLFGWLLILFGTVQLCISVSTKRPTGWGWWLAGGVLDMFIGFEIVRSISFAEIVFPYFIALVFLFWGISALVGAINQRKRRYWWLSVINGILLLLIGFFFIDAGWAHNMIMTSVLVSLAFIYWGFSIIMTSYDMRPLEIS
jgi:uncharacterized membrane protein HdeD (DUF308 family)